MPKNKKKLFQALKIHLLKEILKFKKLKVLQTLHANKPAKLRLVQLTVEIKRMKRNVLQKIIV